MAKLKGTTYYELSQLIEPGETRTIGNNTTAYRRNDDTRIYVYLHRNPIVILHPTGHVEVTTAGWDTVTTRDRLNQFLAPVNARAHRVRGELVLTTPGGTRTWDGLWFGVVAR